MNISLSISKKSYKNGKNEISFWGNINTEKVQVNIYIYVKCDKILIKEIKTKQIIVKN